MDGLLIFLEVGCFFHFLHQEFHLLRDGFDLLNGVSASFLGFRTVIIPLVICHNVLNELLCLCDIEVSTKASRQSTLGYTHGSNLSADRCASYELDGDARHRQGFYLGSAIVWA